MDKKPENRRKAIISTFMIMPINLAGFQLYERLVDRVDTKIGAYAATFVAVGGDAEFILYPAVQSPAESIRKECSGKIAEGMKRPMNSGAFVWGHAMVHQYGGKPSADELKKVPVAKLVPKEQYAEALQLAFKSADALIAKKSTPVPWELAEPVQANWLEQHPTPPASKVGSDIDSKHWLSFIKRRSDLSVPLPRKENRAAINAEPPNQTEPATMRPHW